MKLVDLTEQVNQNVNASAVPRLLKNEFSQATNVELWRGDGNVKPIIIDPSNHKKSRQSLTGDNIVMEVLKILESWSEFPDRRRSLVMSSQADVADGFGQRNRIYPINDAVVGVSQVSDFNDTWPTFKRQDWAPSIAIYRVFNETANAMGLSINTRQPPKLTIDQLDTALKLRKRKLYHVFSGCDGADTVYNYLNDTLLNPKKNGFYVTTIGKLDVQPNVEVWTEDKCLLVPEQPDPDDYDE